MPDFGEGRAALQDAYVEFRYFPKAALRAGKFKTPFGLERLVSATDLLFVERGLPTAIVPNRDLGLQVSGDLAGGRLNYAVGVFNGVVDGGSADGDVNDAKDYAIRLFARPFLTSLASHPLRGLGVGIAASTGKQSGALPAFKSAGQLTFFSYGADVTASGARTRVSPQAYYYRGPLGLLAEFVESTQRVQRGAASIKIRNYAWQAVATYMLTGEAKSYGSTAPARMFDPGKGNWGAWELSARTGQLRVDPQAFSRGLADPQRSARWAREWGAGINWYLNQSVKISLDYMDTGFTGGAMGGANRTRERAVLNRFQIVL
jgi:phosphate-selective porin OprO/OprP